MLAVAGAWFAVDAWSSGSLWRYRLAGYVVAGVAAMPLLSLVLFAGRAVRAWRKAGFAMVPLLALLMLLELLVRLFGAAVPSPMRLVRDERLGHVAEPHTGGTDDLGFRNPAVPPRCDVLVVGDSQTWGFGVAYDETFTARLGAATGAATYQMANGSYGPVQYVELVRRGLAMRPKLVVVALYFGNDLVDAADFTGLVGAEALRTQGVAPRLRDELGAPPDRAPNLTMATVDWLLAQSRVLTAAAGSVKAHLRGGMLDDQPGAVRFDDARIPTVLLPGYRLPIVDPQRDGVHDGIAVTGRCLAAIAGAVRGADADGCVLLIPTKELAYAEWRGEPLGGLAALAPLRDAERAARRQVIEAAAAAGIEVLDVLPALVAAMARGERVWRRGGDGHLTAAGHEVAALLLAERLR